MITQRQRIIPILIEIIMLFIPNPMGFPSPFTRGISMRIPPEIPFPCTSQLDTILGGSWCMRCRDVMLRSRPQAEWLLTAESAVRDGENQSCTHHWTCHSPHNPASHFSLLHNSSSHVRLRHASGLQAHVLNKKYFRLWLLQTSRIAFSHVPIEFSQNGNSANRSADPV